MRILLRIAIFAAILWGGYWLAISQLVPRGVSAWLADRQTEGWQAETSSTSFSGFPAVFRVQLDDIALADPDTGLAWAAPVFSLEAPAYNPMRVTAIWPQEHRVSTPFERIEVRSAQMDAGMGLDGGLSFTLDTSDVILRDLTLTSNRGWQASLDAGTLTTRRTAEAPLSHTVAFSTTGFTPPKEWRSTVDPAGLLPESIAELGIDAVIAFDAPWDRRAIEERRPQITNLDLGMLRAAWGGMLLEAAGALSVDASGIPDGRITVRAVNWRDMLNVLANTGTVPEGLLPTLENALGVLAGLSGNPDTIDAPLSFQGGFMSLGPIPLGPAPRLTLR